NIIKRKNQFFIQTWHGDTGMKKILLDSKRRKGKPVNDSKYTDLAISGSELSVNKYHTAFNYHGEILKMGTPRNDRLVCRDLAAETRLKCKLNIEENAKILLYAPTFRAGNGLQSVDVNINEVLKTLEDKYDQKWVCLIRAHSGSGGIDIECDGNRFISVSDYPDMSDLLAICDMLLTDYSSCAGDPIRVKKPVILAQFDKKEYISADRELYYDPEEAGFIVAYDQEQLINILKTYTVDDYNKSCEKIMAYFDIVESGKTSDEICKRINDFYCKTFCGEKSH
ncbi:MAG: CDP-glycerol glycerophosphotransferase family protein, partial [Clostridia bacterium]|nr:CDP-glycerol glycerophosphotransferase family protein [Clostridia bacterium]